VRGFVRVCATEAITKKKQHIELQQPHRALRRGCVMREDLGMRLRAIVENKSCVRRSDAKAFTRRLDRTFGSLFFALHDAAKARSKACFAYASRGAT
jgi:hypothetical protein